VRDPHENTFVLNLAQRLLVAGREPAPAPTIHEGGGIRPLARDAAAEGTGAGRQAAMDVASAMRTILEGHSSLIRPPGAALRHLATALHEQMRAPEGPRALPLYAAVAQEFAAVDALHGLLADRGSKKLLVDLVAHRILGSGRAPLPLDTPDRAAAIRHCASLRADGQPIQLKWRDLLLDPLDLRALGFDLSLHASGEGVLCAFVQRQYEYVAGGVRVCAERGDTVIDAGVCWGDTLLYFAHQTGPTGRVFGFEFVPSHLSVARTNLARNPRHARHVELVEHAVWETSGDALHYVDWGPGSRIVDASDPHDGHTTTLSIDDLVDRKGLDRVDFIKMDIEGAEAPALRGAMRSIKRFHPKLAISLYHSMSDFVDVPKIIESTGLRYRYYLAHHTPGVNETVLFADPVRG
jgi:FkbM family methyltransferase